MIALTDGSGAIAERYAYSAYGEPVFTNASGTVLTDSAKDNRYTYTGREWDEELSLYHFRARIYDADGGRFCARDPIGYADYENHYTFVSGSVASKVDPFGLCSIKAGPTLTHHWNGLHYFRREESEFFEGDAYVGARFDIAVVFAKECGKCCCQFRQYVEDFSHGVISPVGGADETFASNLPWHLDGGLDGGPPVGDPDSENPNSKYLRDGCAYIFSDMPGFNLSEAARLSSIGRAPVKVTFTFDMKFRMELINTCFFGHDGQLPGEVVWSSTFSFKQTITLTMNAAGRPLEL